jgi:glycosidase
MQWEPGRNAGFSSASDTWLPIPAAAEQINVARQLDDSASLLSFYRRLIWYRKRTPCLTDGTYRAIDSAPGTYIYERTLGAERMVVALNFESERRKIDLEGLGRGKVELSTDAAHEGSDADLARLELGPVEGMIVRVS